MTDRYPEFHAPADEHWLKRYYLSRAIFSLIWVALAFSVGRQSAAGAAVLLVVYPAWDALANFVDLARSGGWRQTARRRSTSRSAPSRHWRYFRR